MTGRGCGAVLLFAVAALLTWLSFVWTFEMETFPGLRDNTAPFAVFSVVLASGATAGALAAAGHRSRIALVATACVVVALGWRLWTVAPAMHCSDFNSVARNDDGSYDCFDR
jgi:hypothetical protein